MSVLQQEVKHFNKLQTLIRQTKKELEEELHQIDLLTDLAFKHRDELNRLEYESNKILKEWKKLE